MKSKLLANLLILILSTAAVLGATLNKKEKKHEKHEKETPDESPYERHFKPHFGHGHHHGHFGHFKLLRQESLSEKHERSFWSSPESDVISYGTKLHFTVNATSLETDCFESATFMLNKLSWKVKFCKISAGNSKNNRVADALDGYLIYSFDEFDDDWLSEALVVFQPAITNDKVDGKIVKNMKHQFDKETSQHSIELLDWQTLEANCVDENNQFSVYVEVFVGPKRNKASDMTQMMTDFRVVVDEVSELGETESAPVFLQGAYWTVVIRKDSENVSVYLHQSDYEHLDVNEWSWNVTMSASLLPFDSTAHMNTAQFTHSFYMEKSWGFENFVSYENFTKFYVKNNKAVFVVNLKVDPPQPLWEVDDVMNNLHKLF